MTDQQTTTVSTDQRYWLCGCCTAGGCGADPDLPLSATRVVVCRECGAACSCEGCIAEEDS